MSGIDKFTPSFFDESSAEWRKNKKRKGQMFVYICAVEGCSRKRGDVFCSQHAVAAAAEPKPKKLTSRYNLRKRSTDAPVHTFYNTRSSVHS
jgi:hypothetical protein